MKNTKGKRYILAIIAAICNVISLHAIIKKNHGTITKDFGIYATYEASLEDDIKIQHQLLIYNIIDTLFWFAVSLMIGKENK